MRPAHTKSRADAPSRASCEDRGSVTALTSDHYPGSFSPAAVAAKCQSIAQRIRRAVAATSRIAVPSRGTAPAPRRAPIHHGTTHDAPLESCPPQDGLSLRWVSTGRAHVSQSHSHPGGSTPVSQDRSSRLLVRARAPHSEPAPAPVRGVAWRVAPRFLSGPVP